MPTTTATEIHSYVDDDGSAAVWSDELNVRFYPDRDNSGEPTGLLRIRLAAKMQDGGRMADYTPEYEYSATAFRPSEVRIAHDGMLTAMSQRSATTDIRWGLSVQLPSGFVTPVRSALAAVLDRMGQAAKSQA